RSTSGTGQGVDAAMLDGVALLMGMIHGMLASGSWQPGRGVNPLDGGAPYYGVYETADGGHVAVGAIEAPFYDRLVRVLGLDPASLPDQADRSTWPEVRSRFAEIFRSRTRDGWCEVFEGEETCVARGPTTDA